MIIQTAEDIDGLEKAGQIAYQCLSEMRNSIVPGMTTLKLDLIARRFLQSYGARSAPELCYKFPGATCISVNEIVAHGVPSSYVIKAGDLVHLDVSVEKDGYFSDTGASVLVESKNKELIKLCDCAQLALDNACKIIRHGTCMGQIHEEYRRALHDTDFELLTNLTGHGIGKHLHEEPRGIPDLNRPFDPRILTAGMVISIEPFVTTGPTIVKEREGTQGFSVPHGYRAAQYEHTLIVLKDSPLILTYGS